MSNHISFVARTSYVIVGVLSLFLLLSLPVPETATAQDTTLPVALVNSIDVIESAGGKKVTIYFVPSATDDVQVATIEYRGKLNKNSFSPWSSIPYADQIVLQVNLTCTQGCTSFASQFRAIDTAENVSPTITRSFKFPYSGTPGTELTDQFPIQDPPTVSVVGTKAIIVLKRFIAPKGSRSSSTLAAVDHAGDQVYRWVMATKKKKPKSSVVYVSTVTNTITQEVRTLTSKKNVLTVKNLAPGSYTTSYKAQLIKKKVVVAESLISPPRTFSVN